jgi:uncharacterized protein (TIGR03437 family)
VPIIQCGGVINSTNPAGGIASGTWITIYGSSLSSTTRPWNQSDFTGNNLPTSLDGVQVLVNGQLAYVYYISPTQVNVLAPLDGSVGPVPVEVINNAGSSNLVTIAKGSIAPSLFAYSQQSGKYVIAQDASSYGFLGPVGIMGSGTSTTPAVPGESIVLYATGLGQTSPFYPDGQIVQSPLPLIPAPQVSIGGMPATVQFAGLIGPGLYQINAVVPQVPAGDAVVSLNLSGGQSPAGVFLSIQ